MGFNSNAKENPEYIKEISIPFCIKTYSLEQVNILENKINGNVLLLIYFDATGNIVKNPTNDEKESTYTFRFF